MRTPTEVAAHEKKANRLLIWGAADVALIVVGESLNGSVADYVLSIGGVLLVVLTLRGSYYVMTDLRLRGRSPLWAYFVGHPVGFALWIAWRRKHPVPTRDTVGRPPPTPR